MTHTMITPGAGHHGTLWGHRMVAGRLQLASPTGCATSMTYVRAVRPYFVILHTGKRPSAVVAPLSCPCYNTEKVRSELLIAPILVELRKQTGRTISFFSGVDFTVDESQGLNGVCDYIISRSPEQLFISAPVLIIFEAKNENIKGGLPQCIAAMIAAQRFNQREGNMIPVIHGAVTTGTTWRFLQLENNTIRIDDREYYIDSVDKIMGILTSITGHTLAPALT